ncbi:hypothetical protein [Streptomyces syringium]|uniref:hypothetical protein n=1 Tax=Streptomyces syringium TaxID=76729 RepID=UPI0033FD0A6B
MHHRTAVRAHRLDFQRVVADGEHRPPDLGGAYLRLVPDDFLRAEAAAAFSYARPVVDGLLEAIALDTPDAVRLLDDKGVAEIGLEALRSAARANLINEPVDRETVCHNGALIHLIAGDSFFVASKALVLPELLRTYLGQEPPADGVLLALPSRHRMAIHWIADEHAVSAVNALASFGLGAYQDAVGDGQLSPRLYWWYQGQVDLDHAHRPGDAAVLHPASSRAAGGHAPAERAGQLRTRQSRRGRRGPGLG